MRIASWIRVAALLAAGCGNNAMAPDAAMALPDLALAPDLAMLPARTGQISSPAIGANGTVHVGSHDHNVYAVDGATGMKSWAFATGNVVEPSPAIGADGTIYVGSADNKVYAIGP